jgi:hypothetical protein
MRKALRTVVHGYKRPSRYLLIDTVLGTMPTPVSIGDAILLAKLTYRLGRTLTVDRAETPRSLKEIRNQFSAIQYALDSLGISSEQNGEFQSVNASGDESTEQRNNDSNPQKQRWSMEVNQMVRQCYDTLCHLEALLEKYKILVEPESHTEVVARTSRFKRGVKEQWKRIRFITENDEFKKIREDLSTHVEALVLTVATITS